MAMHPRQWTDGHDRENNLVVCSRKQSGDRATAGRVDAKERAVMGQRRVRVASVGGRPKPARELGARRFSALVCGLRNSAPLAVSAI
jgi:hypothetical protein